MKMPQTIGLVHFIGIGGIGMSGIAEVLHNLGYKVQGSDQADGANVQRLRDKGIECLVGHKAENIGDAEVVVVSTAIKKSNPELKAAREKLLPIVRRAEMLAELMRFRQAVAIGGTHGKTTTTSMVATLLEAGGLDPTVINGGIINAYGTNARMGDGEWMVVEADESDGTFLKLPADIAVVTNIDREHLDHYKDIDEIRAAFRHFVNKVPFYGCAILCLDDENIQRILPDITRRTMTYGTSPQVDLVITSSSCTHFESEFSLRLRGKDLGSFKVRVPGFHNVLNATAAIAVALELEVGLDQIRTGLAAFSGVDRRFQTRGEVNGITVIDDYGHHPTEIRATLAAAQVCNFRRVLAIFQPHRYTRTQALLEEFARSFNKADIVYVMDIYAASEKPIEGVSGEGLAAKMRAYGHRAANYVGSMDAAIDAVVKEAQPGDLIMTLGAGSVSQAGDKILERLRGGS